MTIDGSPWCQWLLKTNLLHDWEHTCEDAERRLPQLAQHLATWGPHCGAPRAIYRGQLVRMLIDLCAGPRNAQDSHVTTHGEE